MVDLKLPRELPIGDILASQYVKRRSVRGEINLFWGVLLSGVEQFQKHAFPGKKVRRDKNLFKEASDWIFCDKTQWLFSFESVCAILDIDPAYIREGLRKWLEGQKLKRVEK